MEVCLRNTDEKNPFLNTQHTSIHFGSFRPCLGLQNFRFDQLQHGVVLPGLEVLLVVPCAEHVEAHAAAAVRVTL